PWLRAVLRPAPFAGSPRRVINRAAYRVKDTLRVVETLGNVLEPGAKDAARASDRFLFRAAQYVEPEAAFFRVSDSHSNVFHVPSLPSKNQRHSCQPEH